MIDKALLLRNIPSHLGEQIHINHEGCPAGVDTKFRLYIKKDEKGLLAYCHHCGDKGFIHKKDLNELPYRWEVRGLRYRAITKPVPDMCGLSIEGKAWLSKYNCDWNPDYFRGIVGDDSKVSLILRNQNWDVVGHQIRNLIPNSVPKYITHINDTVKGHTAWFHVPNNKTLVITEDYLSSYRIHRDVPNHSAMALLKTNLSDYALRQIEEIGFNNIYIWLDPDNAGVRGRKNTLRKLAFYLPRTTKLSLLVLDKEPKQCSVSELINTFISRE